MPLPQMPDVKNMDLSVSTMKDRILGLGGYLAVIGSLILMTILVGVLF